LPLLEIEDMHSYYGHIEALRGISLTVDEGEVVTLIGSNGAGKTTTLRSIHGILPPKQGRIIFAGEEIQGVPAHELISRGIAQSPEGRRIFFRMTVLENLEMGAYHRNDASGIREDMDRVYDLFPRLKERTKQEAGTMSGGEQQMSRTPTSPSRSQPAATSSRREPSSTPLQPPSCARTRRSAKPTSARSSFLHKSGSFSPPERVPYGCVLYRM
jgi:ABC-type histidine transport system ATPase subunit